MIFLDNASTTRVSQETMQVYSKYACNMFFNPSAPYKEASEIKKDINQATTNILNYLNGEQNSKLIFTSCATESNNTAILGQISKRFKKVLLSIGEHSSVMNLVNHLKNMGYEVDFIKLNESGSVDIDDFKAKMTKDVGMVSIMYVSNETGAVNPIKELVNITKSINKDCIFHCDGVQAMCKYHINLKDLGVDLFTFSGHKFHAPKGIAVLYSKKEIKPYIIGGGQQNQMRSGTENVSGIMSLDYVIKNIDVDKNFEKVKILNNYVRNFFKDKKDILINSSENASPYILSISFCGINGATLVNALNNYDICIGTGSACSTNKAGNTTLNAMGKSKQSIMGSVRMSFSAENTIEEVVFVCEKMLEEFNKLKNILGRK